MGLPDNARSMLPPIRQTNEIDEVVSMGALGE
jgi:hypothetical protein